MTLPIDPALLAIHVYDELIFGGFICTHCTPDDAVTEDDTIPFPCPPLRAAGMTNKMAEQVIKAHREQVRAGHFNEHCPVGTPVRYWTGDRHGDGKTSLTRSSAELLFGRYAVVWVDGESSCIALSHVQVLTEADSQ